MYSFVVVYTQVASNSQQVINIDHKVILLSSNCN